MGNHEGARYWAGVLAAMSLALLGGCEQCSPPACSSEGLECAEDEQAVCQQRRCAPIAEEGQPCSIDPCNEGAICPFGTFCRPLGGTSGGLCLPGRSLNDACEQDSLTEGCTWPLVCSSFSDSTDDPACPPRPPNTPPSADATCTIGRQVGQSCQASWDEEGLQCLRCEPGLDCINGRCMAVCETDDDCPCDVSCDNGFCFQPCTPGEVCTVAPGECGFCFESSDGTHCVPGVGVEVVDGECAVDETPDACEPLQCEEGQRLICGGTRCANVGEGPPTMDTCDPDPCTSPNPTPTVCDWNQSCFGGPNFRCQQRSSTPVGVAPACSPRSPNSIDGTPCPFPLVCRGFSGERGGAAGGCPARPDDLPPDVYPDGACVLGQTRGQECDATFLEPVSSCLRCEPGLECIDSRCTLRCASNEDCPCEEVCNGGLCGSSCSDEGSECVAAPGVCGTCGTDGTCAPLADPVTEACGSPFVDDDCDGEVDEGTPDIRCDGVDDNCDDVPDEGWSPGREIIPSCDGVCPTDPFVTLRGRYECNDGELTCVAEPGIDFCTAPGPITVPGGYLWCGGGPGDVCASLGVQFRPCFESLTCNLGTGLCVGVAATNVCRLVCEPDSPTVCIPCDRYTQDCVWTGTP